MTVSAGVDVGKRTIVVAVVASDGTLLEAARIDAGPTGAIELLRLLRRHSHRHPERTRVAIEDPHGLLVAKLMDARFEVYAIHPVASCRFRERHSISGAKDDKRDAIALANLIRTEPHAHRRVPRDSELAQALFALTRGQRDQTLLVRSQFGRLHSVLSWHYPGSLACFKCLSSRTALITLKLAPTPAAARRLSESRLRRALQEGHVPNARTLPARLLPVLRQAGFRLPALVEQEYGDRALSLIASIEREQETNRELTERILSRFQSHPDHPIYASFPALGGVLGARMLAEIGDDLERFRSGRGVAALAGVRPITKASGSYTYVKKRFIYNHHLGHAVHMWSLQLVLRSPAAAAMHERYRARGGSYCTALRKVAAVYLEILFSCLRSGQHYDEHRVLERLQRNQSADLGSETPATAVLVVATRSPLAEPERTARHSPETLDRSQTSVLVGLVATTSPCAEEVSLAQPAPAR